MFGLVVLCCGRQQARRGWKIREESIHRRIGPSSTVSHALVGSSNLRNKSLLEIRCWLLPLSLVHLYISHILIDILLSKESSIASRYIRYMILAVCFAKYGGASSFTAQSNNLAYDVESSSSVGWPSNKEPLVSTTNWWCQKSTKAPVPSGEVW